MAVPHLDIDMISAVDREYVVRTCICPTRIFDECLVNEETVALIHTDAYLNHIDGCTTTKPYPCGHPSFAIVRRCACNARHIVIHVSFRVILSRYRLIGHITSPDSALSW